MAIVEVSNTYDISSERLWRMATNFDALAKVTARFVSFEGLPSGQIEAGQKIDVKVRLFGWMPAQDYRMELIAFDPDAKRFESLETGAGVKRWYHTCTVTADGEGARLTDNIDIRAGLLTPFAAMWARLLYASRHSVRLDLIKSGEF